MCFYQVVKNDESDNAGQMVTHVREGVVMSSLLYCVRIFLDVASH